MKVYERVEEQEPNHELAQTKAAKEMKQKAKSEGLKNLKSTWEEIPFMASTHYEPITLMLTKREPTSGFVAQD